jgi:hypothetical protein
VPDATPTAQEIADAAATAAAEGVASASGDGESATAMDPEKQLDIADRLAAREIAAGTNRNGGAVSGWAMLRPARVIPPGGS